LQVSIANFSPFNGYKTVSKSLKILNDENKRLTIREKPLTEQLLADIINNAVLRLTEHMQKMLLRKL